MKSTLVSTRQPLEHRFPRRHSIEDDPHTTLHQTLIFFSPSLLPSLWNSPIVNQIYVLWMIPHNLRSPAIPVDLCISIEFRSILPSVPNLVAFCFELD